MTMQAADHMRIGKKLYKLIDVEADKQIITCADFGIPENPEIIALSTACWRGYTANYYVIKNMLYGIKSIDNYNKIKKSKKIKIPYTGSCIIAYGNGWNSDFLSAYIDYDEAYELYFENGELKKKESLISAIEEAKALKDTDEYKNKMEPNEYVKLREKIARKPLKYKYSKATYKWR